MGPVPGRTRRSRRQPPPPDQPTVALLNKTSNNFCFPFGRRVFCCSPTPDRWLGGGDCSHTPRAARRLQGKEGRRVSNFEASKTKSQKKSLGKNCHSGSEPNRFFFFFGFSLSFLSVHHNRTEAPPRTYFTFTLCSKRPASFQSFTQFHATRPPEVAADEKKVVASRTLAQTFFSSGFSRPNEKNNAAARPYDSLQ